MKTDEMDEFTACSYKRRVGTYTWHVISVEEPDDPVGLREVEVVPNTIPIDKVLEWFQAKYGDGDYRLTQTINTQIRIRLDRERYSGGVVIGEETC